MARHQPPPATTVQQSISKFFTRQTGYGNNQPTPAAPVATASSRPSNNARQLQGNLSEDEALARALQASMSETGNGNPSESSTNGALSQEEQDRMLAMALAQSEREARGGGTTTTTSSNSSNDKTCQIS